MPGIAEQWLQMAAASGQGFLVPPMSPEQPGITDPVDAAWALTRLTSMPLLTHQQPIHLSSNAARQLPCAYILCTQFGFHATAREAQDLGWDSFNFETGHDAMITLPRELAQMLNQSIAAKQ